MVFGRRIDGTVYDFGVSGFLRGNNLLMYDCQTESWWQQFTGDALVGDMTGTQLEFLPGMMTSWREFKELRPGGKVLSKDTGYDVEYGQTNYPFYDISRGPDRSYWDGDPDQRFYAFHRVAAVSINGVDKAYPFLVLEEEPVVHDTVGGEDIVIFFAEDIVSPLHTPEIKDGRVVGGAAVFRPEANGTRLTFYHKDGAILDWETDSLWSPSGEALEGTLKGTRLEGVPHTNPFWFVWAEFNPKASVYQGAAEASAN